MTGKAVTPSRNRAQRALVFFVTRAFEEGRFSMVDKTAFFEGAFHEEG
jgi:hypothetical protein